MNHLIVILDRKGGVAKKGYMPWNIPEDQDFFTRMTKTLGGHVLSGGVTYRNAYGGKPLVDRHNYILTHDPTPIEGAVVVNDLKSFLDDFNEELWVSGGSVVFEEIFKLDKADVLYITHVDADFGCDQFFPEYKDDYDLVEESERREQNGFYFTYARYTKKST